MVSASVATCPAMTVTDEIERPEDAAALDAAVASEKRRLLVDGTTADVLGSVGAVIVIVLAEYAHADHARIALWAGGMLALLLGQLLFVRLQRGASDARFLSRFVGLAVALALGWASCALLVRPDDFSFEAFDVLALCVIFTAGSVYNAHHLPALYGFQFAGQGALTLIYAVRGGASLLNGLIAAGFAILMWTLVGYGRSFHRGLVRAVELGFENSRLVAQLQRRTQALEQANIAKTRFLASASHDLRQPLHAISLLISLLGERARGQPPIEDLIRRVESSTEVMETLLNGILDISRLDAGVERPRIGAVPARQILERLERQFAPIATAHGLQLRVRVDSRAWVRSDPALLARMLDNLVANALRYTPRGGRVLVALRPRRGGEAAFEVRDNGIGIPADKLDEVFEEIVQLHNPRRERSMGLGLGLSIVRRTARLLAHLVEVRSMPGRGSVFRIVVPLADAGSPVEAGPRADTGTPDGLIRLRVLVVDDEAPIREALRELLEAWGCDCITAADGAEAMDRLDDDLDALLCDYRFEQETGVALVLRLRERLGRDVPALIVTGDVTAHQLIDIASSDLPVMHKPVNPAALRRWLASAGSAVQA
jgi:signal transduction histidine kinase